MESRLIYQVSDRIKHHVCWPKLGDTEWIYFGAGDEVDTGKVQQVVSDFFLEEEIYVAFDRNNSFVLDKQNFLQKSSAILGSENFLVWDKHFDKVIEFSNIGVFRQGGVCR